MELQRNVLNEQELRDYASALADPHTAAKPFVAKWLKTTFVKWLKQESPYMRQCMSERDQRSPLMAIASQLFASFNFASIVSSTIKFVPTSSLDSWAVKALEDHNLWWFDMPAKDSADHASIEHWIDWMRAEAPDRDLRMTVPHVIDAVAKWDKKLSRQKMISELSVGVEVVETEAFDSMDETLVLVKLKTEEAYRNEGAAMSHCVAVYWGRQNTEIYSLRSADKKRPIATIEVVKRQQSWAAGGIQQIRGHANSKVDEKYVDAIHMWATANLIAHLGEMDEACYDNCEGEDIDVEDDDDVEDTVRDELEKQEAIERQKELEEARAKAAVQEEEDSFHVPSAWFIPKKKGRPPRNDR